MGMTVVEKILSRAAGVCCLKAGDVVEPAVDVAMSHENAALVINQFKDIYKDTGIDARVFDPSKIVIIFDHRVPAVSSKTATNQKKIREFVAAQGISKFHDIRGDTGGICHQILPENGYVRPGDVVVGTDSHTTSHGALGAFAFGIGATEMASAWALGAALNVDVPPPIKVVVIGVFSPWVGPRAERPSGRSPQPGTVSNVISPQPMRTGATFSAANAGTVQRATTAATIRKPRVMRTFLMDVFSESLF